MMSELEKNLTLEDSSLESVSGGKMNNQDKPKKGGKCPACKRGTLQHLTFDGEFEVLECNVCHEKFFVYPENN